ncbi:hypothetical protein CTAYLR_002713 [Chrysophaeum taylorii]|uniref:Gamma-glutamylcyclotransferase n=1 Tax=Chrysophaeum taylorii TaxID=2483200 RepID=A0AAD7XKS9_9STRA|nr:hypothetical protein CTAYLR_002713 [Chrysophaeum taylorii]
MEEVLRTSSTIVGYGALLSPESSRLTFPGLKNFRLVRIQGWRRVFAHPHLFLMSRGLLDVDTMRLASLSAEPCDGASFVAAAFDVMLDDAQRAAFLLREREYSLVRVDCVDLVGGRRTTGVMCARNTDAACVGVPRPTGIRSIWDWPPDSGLLPADVYLRHVLLAAEKAGAEAEQSFLRDTFLADRVTTLAAYLVVKEQRDAIMRSGAALPPDLRPRFSG